MIEHIETKLTCRAGAMLAGGKRLSPTEPTGETLLLPLNRNIQLSKGLKQYFLLGSVLYEH